MPTNLPDQNWTVPTGTDLADNPTAFTDFASDVLQTVVLRYPNVATRDAFNGSRVAGDLSCTAGRTWYDRWTGSAWKPLTPLQAFKSAGQTVNNSTVLVNDTQLFINFPSVTGGCVYLIEGFISYTSNATADFKIAVAASVNITALDFAPVGLATTAAGTVGDMNAPVVSGSAPAFGGAAAAAAIMLNGRLNNSTGVGDVFQIQWAQNTADPSNTTVNSGSWIRLTALQT